MEMKPSRSRILEALREVKDPELGISIVELGLVKKVELEGKRVQVHVDLTIEGCPLKDQIRREVGEAVQKAVPGAELELSLGVMTREELEMLRRRLGAQRSAAIGSARRSRSRPASTSHRCCSPSAG